jgi:hypothetical protein
MSVPLLDDGLHPRVLPHAQGRRKPYAAKEYCEPDHDDEKGHDQVQEDESLVRKAGVLVALPSAAAA